MVLTRKNRSTRIIVCHSAILFTANLTNRTDLGSNPGLRGEWTATNSLSQVTVSGGKP
jgi:hypothetical protein